MNYRPIVFALICSLTGIIDAYFFVMQNYLLSILLLSFFIFLITFFIINLKGDYLRHTVIALCLFLIFVFFAFNFYFKVNSFDNANLNTQQLLITGKVSEIKNTENGERITLKNNTAKGTFNGKLKYNVLVYVDGETEYDIGDVVYFYGVIYDDDYIYENKLQAYKITDGKKYHAFVSNTDLIKSGEEKSVFDKIHIRLRDTLKQNMSAEGFSVSYALLLGNSDYIDSDIISNFRSAGVAHIFAVSGLHIGFLATILFFVLKKLRVNGIVNVIVCSVVLFLYSGVCGFSASSIRAVIMSVVLLVSTVLGTKYDMLTSISIAGLIILLISPVQLFCVGFQLSFGVVLGIMLLSKKIAVILPIKNEKVSNLIGGVVSAQLISIPICLYAFNEFSLIAIIANLLFIPIIGVIYGILFVVSVITSIIAINFLFVPINYIIFGVIFLIKAFDYSVFMIGGITFGIYSLFYYVAILLSSDVVNVKRGIRITLISLLSLTFIIGTVFLNFSEKNSEKCYVIGDRDICAVLFTSKDNNTLLVSNLKSGFSFNRIDRALNNCYNKSINRVIISESEQTLRTDIIIAKLHDHYDIKEVIIYDNIDEELKEILSKMFFTINLKYCFSNEKIAIGKATFSYKYDGYAVNYTNNGKNFLVFSSLSRGISGDNDNMVYDELIVTDYIEILKARFNGKNIIAYNSKNYNNAYKRGNYLIKIS